MDAGCWGGGTAVSFRLEQSHCPARFSRNLEMLLFGSVRPLSYRSFSKPRSPRVSGHGEGRRRDFEMVAVAVVAVVAVGPDDSHFTQTQRHKVATSLFPHPSLSSSPVWALKTGCDASFETKKDTIIIPRPQHLTRSSTIRPEQLLQLWLIGSGHWATRARQQIPASSNKALAFSFASLHRPQWAFCPNHDLDDRSQIR